LFRRVISKVMAVASPMEFTPDRAGEFLFTCGMGMLRGTLVVQPI
jgi:plastocyanin domain-containing protein